MRVSSTASEKRSGSSPKPGASRRITAGVKASASASSTIWLAEQQREDAVAEQFCGVRARPASRMRA